MPAGLAWLSQEDFSAGMITSVARHLLPPNGVREIVNGLLDDDGSVYRRGGSALLPSPTPISTVSWVWDGHLLGGHRTLLSSGTYKVLAADGSPINLALSGPTMPVRPVVIGGMLFTPGAAGIVYAGSRKPAYAAGTITLTQGSKTVTGVGTAWLANVDTGMLFAGASRFYVVESVQSDTSLTLTEPWEEATSVGGGYVFIPAGATAAMQYRKGDALATVAERLISFEGSRIYFSEARTETGGLRMHVFNPTDYHELGEGAQCLGGEALRDLLVVFSTNGVWTVSNMAYDLTDAAGNVQQQLQRTSQDVILWGQSGLASYRGALVVPGVDGVYLVDAVAPPVPVSESITPTLIEHVRAGRHPGGATVFKNHYFLPVLEGTTVVDLLVGRLDRPVRTRGRVFFPWSRFTGHGGSVGTLAVRAAFGETTQLLGASLTGSGLLDLTGMFTPSASVKNDADGTTHTFAVETRDFPTGTGNVNTVRRARVRYEMIDAGTDDPVLSASYSVGTDAFTALTGDGPEDTGVNKHTWNLQAAGRYVRLRLESTDPAARLTLRSVEIAVRESAKDR